MPISACRQKELEGATTVAGTRESVDPNVVVLACAAILDHGKVLVVREEDEPYHGGWVLPQGYTKTNETLADAARREAREELGVEIEISGLLGVYEDFVKGTVGMHYIIVCYSCRVASHDQIRSTPEVIDSVWTDPSQTLGLMPPVFKEILRDVRSLKRRRRYFGLPRSEFIKG
jgi:ADP-ribose pyrophosphatase YjhB (NUDIX family)